MQKRLRFGFHDNFASTTDIVFASRYFKSVQRSDRRFSLTLRVAEGCEVMLTEQVFRAFLHSIYVQLLFHVPNKSLFNRREGRTLQDTVTVELVNGMKTRVEVIIDNFGINYADRLRAHMGV